MYTRASRSDFRLACTQGQVEPGEPLPVTWQEDLSNVRERHECMSLGLINMVRCFVVCSVPGLTGLISPIP